MIKRAVGFSILIAAAEAVVYTWACTVSPNDTMYFTLAARYSARISFLIFASLLCWMGISGLKTIYANENKRQLFVCILFSLALNHLIHFYFLAMNFEANGLELIVFKNLPGAATYVVLTVAPLLLWNKTDLTKRRYRMILSGFAMVSVLFIGTYIKRFSQEMVVPVSRYLLVFNLTTIVILIGLNVFRVVREGKKM
jgi:hypothetical protein